MNTLHARWQALLRAEPRAAMLQADAITLTRADVGRLVDAERECLQRSGIGHGDVVAWLGINTPQMLAALFACARLGAVFMPLNLRLAGEELAAVLRHAGAKCLFGSADMRAQIAALQAGLPEAGEPARAAAPDAEGRPGDDLLLAYTSGTTGRPKGALHTQAAMLANADAAIEVQGLGPDTRTLAVLPLFHVGGLCIQTLPTLLAGGQVLLHPRFDAGAWLRAVAAWRPSTSVLVPATLRMVIEHAEWPAADLSSLAFLTTGSSVVPLALIEAFHARGVPVSQVYGATETGPVSIVLRPHEALAHAGSVGMPAPGVEVRLLDERGAEVAEGEIGEIVLRGPNTMRGYHREPAHDAFAEGWFHTGDLACRGADGRFRIAGRRKEMIISGGENIYPAEIENLLAGDPDVAECAVVGVPDAKWGEVPVLALVGRPGVVLAAEAVMARIGWRLARYKHPQRIVVLDALPKTALGKVRMDELRRLIER